jgi:BRCA1-associated protein
MYSIKIASSSGVEEGSKEAAQVTAGSTSGEGSRTVAGSGQPDELESIEFSVGNPRVEHITGLVHIYRELPPRGAGGGEASDAPAPGSLPVRPVTLL